MKRSVPCAKIEMHHNWETSFGVCWSPYLCLSLSLRFVAFDLACSVFFIARSCLCFRTDGLSPNNHSQNNASEHWDTTQDYDKRSSKKEPNEQTQQGSQRTNDPTRRAEKAKSKELECQEAKDGAEYEETEWSGDNEWASGTEDWSRIHKWEAKGWLEIESQNQTPSDPDELVDPANLDKPIRTTTQIRLHLDLTDADLAISRSTCFYTIVI